LKKKELMFYSASLVFDAKGFPTFDVFGLQSQGMEPIDSHVVQDLLPHTGFAGSAKV